MNNTAYIVLDKNGQEVIIEADSPTSALGKFLHRRIGAAWVLTRQPNGWLIASNKGDKTLQRTYHKLRELNYSRFETYTNS